MRQEHQFRTGSPQQKLVWNLQRIHGGASFLVSWSQRVRVVLDSHLCVLHTSRVQSPRCQVVSHGKGQLVNILGFQPIWSLLQLLHFAIMAESSWGFT